jgi:UPF0755 protein
MQVSNLTEARCPLRIKWIRPALAVIAALVIIFIALAAVALGPASIPPEGKLFEISKGASASRISTELEGAGIVKSGFAFSLLLKIDGAASHIKAGRYKAQPGMSSAGILSMIREGKQELERVTFKEGGTLSEVASLLEARGIAGAADFSKAAHDRELLARLGVPGNSAEGYLFPDTYLFPLEFGSPAVLASMVGRFKERLKEIAGSGAMKGEDIRDKVVLASIIEREYRLTEEAPLISSVFVNRLRIGMGLQSCATVVYVITERLGKPHPEIVYDRDLKLDDPYNTYIHRGLPPGPISNPGMVALRAAFEPASTKWLYFRLVDPERGAHHFSSTLEEHLGAARLAVKR